MDLLQKSSKRSGTTYGTFVQERFFNYLGLKRTTFDISTGENVAPAYTVSNSRTPCRTVFPVYSDDSCLASGSAGNSTVEDLLLYQSMLSAYNHRVRTDSTSTPGLPFKQPTTVLTPHIAVGKAALKDQAYCLGLYRTRLPGNIGVASLNNLYLGSRKMPSIGASSSGLEIYHHTGNLSGNMASAFLIPYL
jgi:Beta-lactamase